MKKTSAKKLRELLADARAHNDNQLFKPVLPAPPVVSYRKANRYQRGRWVITRAGYKTDPEHGHFLDAYNKVFPVDNINVKQSALVLALDWASEKYGYTTDEWVKTPFGSWAPKIAIEAALRHYLPHLFAEEGEDATPIEPSGVRETTIYIPPIVSPDVRPPDEVESHVVTTTPDPIVKRITDKLYGEDPAWAESEPVIESRQRPTDEVIKKIPSHGDVLRIEGLNSIEDTDVRVAALDAYSEVWLPSQGLVRDHERAMRAALKAAVPVAHAHLSAHENTTSEDDTSVETDGWYRVVGANVAVFIQATSEHDAKTRVEHMINRMTMDCDLNLYITKRDPEVS